MTLDAAQLTTFAAVVREGSFEAAARALHVTPSAVSQRIRALEQAVGQVLVRRVRPCVATDAGQPLLRLAGQVALLSQEALDAARGALSGAGPGAARTRIAIVVNADSLATWFLPALHRLGDRFVFDLCEEDEEHTADLLRDGSVMAAVTGQNEPVQGCRVERLGAMRYRALAAPEYSERWLGDGPAALAGAPVVVFNRKDQLQHRFLRSLLRRRTVDPPVHFVPSAWGFSHAIRIGLGWGMVPEQIAAEDLAAGRCVEIAPGRHLDVPLFWQHWRIDSTALTGLTASVQEAAGAALRR